MGVEVVTANGSHRVPQVYIGMFRAIQHGKRACPMRAASPGPQEVTSGLERISGGASGAGTAQNNTLSSNERACAGDGGLEKGALSRTASTGRPLI